MARKPPPGKSLAEVNPELAKEWHPKKNGNLTPDDVFAISGKKVWWKCDKGEDHEWISTISNRSNGQGCPVCRGLKVVHSNCLATLNPELAKEWHPNKNGDLTANDVSIGSDHKVWWKCNKGDDHEWEASIQHRTRGRGCPVCAGKKVVLSNCLATLNPELAKEWHPNKNGDLTANDVTLGTHKKVWWKCYKADGHEWISSIANRSKGRGCPMCSGKIVVLSNCLATTHPDISKEWHPTKNGKLTPFDTSKGANQSYWWKCPKGDDHEWFKSPNYRLKRGCPICSGHKVVPSTCLAILNPELAKDWHPTKNGKLTPFDVAAGSYKKVWWKCSIKENHEWKTSISHRALGTGCPLCLNQKISSTNSLQVVNANVSKEWHPSKNGKLTPFDVISGSHKKVWWKCPKGDDHEWEARISDRVGSRNTGCPVCFGFLVVESNSLLHRFPKISKELHPTKNNNVDASKLFYSSNKKVWWKCDKGEDHEWKTTVRHRTFSKSNCPFCTLTPQSKQELTITFELIQFFKIDPRGFKTRVNSKLWSIDIFIPEFSLGIEFDGSFWHKDKRALDKLKTEQLKDEGFKIMRIREAPLKAITDIDIVSKKPFNAKSVTNDVLKHILKTYSLDKKRIRKIEKYLLKKTIQNEKGLDDYIEMILTMKAEKKANHSNNKSD